MSDQGWCKCSSGQNEKWRRPLGRGEGQDRQGLPKQQGTIHRHCWFYNLVDIWKNKIASIKNEKKKHWEIKRWQSRRWRVVDIDNSITINVHAQPLSLRCSLRLAKMAGAFSQPGPLVCFSEMSDRNLPIWKDNPAVTFLKKYFERFDTDKIDQLKNRAIRV